MRGMVATAIAVCLIACGSKPDRKELAAAWQRAVAAKDGAAMFALADAASQQRLRAALDKTRAAIAKDDAVKAIFTTVNAGVDPAAPGDALAAALLARSGDAITDDGATTAIHLEGGRWRVALEPYGFATADGAPVSVHVRLPGATPAAVTHKSYEIHVPIEGSTAAEVLARYHTSLAKIAEERQLPPAWLADTDGVIAAGFANIGGAANDYRATVGEDGTLTSIVVVFDRDTLSNVDHPTALRWGAW